MKTLIVLSFLLTSVVISFSNCKKNKPATASEQLPPETQSGANTFGCLIDGQVFLPKGDPFGGPIKRAQYQFVNGKQGFSVSAKNSGSNLVKSVGFQGDSIFINNGTFDLTTSNTSGVLFGSYVEFQSGNINEFTTTIINRGQLVIKKFDTINQIVSGTFWFDANNINGQVVQVREGRFDMPYVR